jgi:hypothetical protein
MNALAAMLGMWQHISPDEQKNPGSIPSPANLKKFLKKSCSASF